MALNITQFRSALPGGGARNTLFQVQITNPVNSAGDLKTPFLVQATTLPPLSIGVIPVPFVGRQVKVAGNRVYPPWTVTVLNDEDFQIRNALEQWSNAINTFEGNLNVLPTDAPADYSSQALVYQLDKKDNVIRTYEFHNIWPAEISEVDLDWGATDRIQQFQVQFAYDYWTVDGPTGNAGGA